VGQLNGLKHNADFVVRWTIKLIDDGQACDEGREPNLNECVEVSVTLGIEDWHVCA
jgi:hypothetical protein